MPRMLVLVLFLGLVSMGCPGDDDDDSTGDDDSSDDDVTGDDDTGDDDTGDDDDIAEGITLTGPESCGAGESLIYTYWAKGGPPSVTMRLSSIPNYCELFAADWEIFAAAFADYEGYLLAVTEEDGPSACGNLKAFIEAYQTSFDGLAPAGTCTITIEIPTYNGDGTYTTYAKPEENLMAWGTVAVAGDSLMGDVLAALGDCSQIESWDDWVALTDTTDVDVWRDEEFWGLQEGEATLTGAAGEALHVEAADMKLFHPKGSGKLSLNLDMEPCVLGSLPPGF